MGNLAGSRGRPAGAGFTLVELLLTVTLFLLLAAAAVFNFDSFQRGARLDEGASIVESLFRYSRAQAAGTGRTLHVVFEPNASTLGGSTNGLAALSEGARVLWEIDPLNAPGQFVVMAEAASFTDRLNDLVEIRGVRLPYVAAPTNSSPAGIPESGIDRLGNETNGIPIFDESTPQAGRPPIAFYPDGSSDSAEVLLVSRDTTDARRLVISLSGMIGTTRRRWLTLDPNGSVEVEPNEEPLEEEKGK